MRTAKSCEGLTRSRGMTVRLLWVLSGQICAEVQEALTELFYQNIRQVGIMLIWVSQEKVEILLIL